MPHGGKSATAKAPSDKSASRSGKRKKEEKEKRESERKERKAVGFLSILPLRGGCLRASAIRIFEHIFFSAADQVPIVTNSQSVPFLTIGT